MAYDGLMFDCDADDLNGLADELQELALVGADASECHVEFTFQDAGQRFFWYRISTGDPPRLLAYGERVSAEVEWHRQLATESRVTQWRTVNGLTLPWRLEHHVWWATMGPESTAKEGDPPEFVSLNVYERVEVQPLDRDLDSALQRALMVDPNTEIDDERYGLFYRIGWDKVNWGGRWFIGPVIDDVLVDPMKWMEQAKVVDPGYGRP